MRVALLALMISGLAACQPSSVPETQEPAGEREMTVEEAKAVMERARAMGVIVDEDLFSDDPKAQMRVRLKDYAEVLGRGAGCGMNVEPWGAGVGDWLAARTSGQEESDLSVLFMGLVVKARDQQRAGLTGRTCSQVADDIEATNWPHM